MVKLALLWHMHQPYYEDLATGEHILPWVRLHAIKDYWGMVALLREFPGVRLSFNLVPSLLVQVEAFAADRAHDRHLLIGLKPADLLDDDERRFHVANGFHAPFDRMIRPYQRYAELHAKRLQPDAFSREELRDLQVLHKLVWVDPDWRASDPRAGALAAKRRNYSEDDKARLREVELDLLRAVIPAYRQAAATGRVELSTSPFYHPILPLLCDTDAHLRGHPHSALPRKLFSYPQDAREQLTRAYAHHERLFGTRPRGVWPSEGSVSDEVVTLLASFGGVWTATDEEILARSLQRAVTPDDLYRPYRLGDHAAPVHALFRDHQLSDRIGFAYQSWDAQEAARDFVTNVRDAGRRFTQQTSGEVATVTVILDGENAWEHYDGGGRPFLRALYKSLSEADDIQTVTMAEAAAGSATVRPLPSIFPGSWINGDFYIWAGHRDDHQAWRQLAAARATFDTVASTIDSDARQVALEELLIAEGSDWFWWYGDDHSSDHDREFDGLFRRHLRNVYRALGQSAPDDLHVTNITTEAPVGGLVVPGILITPDITDAVGEFADWTSAVSVPLGAGGGTMHRVGGQLLRDLRVAVDRQALFMRLAGDDLVRRFRQGEVRLALLQDRPHGLRLQLVDGAPAPDAGVRLALSHMVAVKVPFAALRVQGGDRVSLSVLVTDARGHVIEQHPGAKPFELVAPTRHHDAINWFV